MTTASVINMLLGGTLEWELCGWVLITLLFLDTLTGGVIRVLHFKSELEGTFFTQRQSRTYNAGFFLGRLPRSGEPHQHSRQSI